MNILPSGTSPSSTASGPSQSRPGAPWWTWLWRGALGQSEITTVLLGGRIPAHIDQAFESLERGLGPDLHDRLAQISDPTNFS